MSFCSQQWNRYPAFYNIQTNSKVFTIIFSVKSQYSDPILKSLVESLEESGYTSDTRLVEGTTLRTDFFLDNIRVATVESHYTWLVASVKEDFYQKLAELLKTDFSYFSNVVGLVRHVEKILPNEDLVVKYRSGLVHSNDMVPYTFVCVFENEKLVGKAILQYLNPETGEYEPTILLIEVLEERQKKAGSSLVDLIERELKENGFTRLWVLNIQNEEFWKKHGYKIDGNQAVKYLGGLHV